MEIASVKSADEEDVERVLPDDQGTRLFGLRFRDQELEAAYLKRNRDNVPPYQRTLLLVAVIAWFGLAIWDVEAESMVAFLPYRLATVPVGLATVAAFGLPRFRPYWQEITQVQMSGAILAIGVASLSLDAEPAGLVFLSFGMAVTSMMAATFFQLSLVRAAVVVVPGVALTMLGVLLSEHSAAVTLGCVAFIIASLFLTGFAAGVLERLSRATFLAGLRADWELRRAERLQDALRAEVAHQVAERSRQLGAALAASSAVLDVGRLTEGQRFAERYRIDEVLGIGGMGLVYSVRRVTDDEHLALKAVVGEVSSAAVARFLREAEIGARVRHENLIEIVDVGVSGGVPFLVMALADQGSLEDYRVRFGDPVWGLGVLRQVAVGLRALHRAGVVHRDLKPGNILLMGGVAKISDFGISRIGATADDAPVNPEAATAVASPRRHVLTEAGTVMGTPLYMAPEAAIGGEDLQPPSDIFAFGLIAYELLTGERAFPDAPLHMVLRGETLDAPPLPVTGRVTKELAALLERCLERDAAARPTSEDLCGAFGI